ncbi:GGDEF domain-containing protein [Dactylosporangium matsuzakiense]|uniref:GGDEF domain-containing protein n=1 Tax=Dactylosporangium matsuzakiense TaxID=53360 RepID=A0A9W6KKJ3_9ACTN|nr:GGDEF domain-containing protein [Dactylosporangium matsuzakiense]GLL03721.1 hypothetical protein GCM10017581_054670 [Dactylosporangium matsuzakiense]
MPSTHDDPDRRQPAAGPGLTVALLLVAAAAVAAAATGHRVPATAGALALVGLSLARQAVTGRRHRQQLDHAVAAARRDPLTGLPNRALAEEMLTSASRGGAPITVALVDVNGLRAINNELGYAAGDAYLRLVAGGLAEAVPPHGVLVRLGGDEFLLLAWGTDPQGLAARIGAGLAGPATIGGFRARPRVSAGIATTATTGGGLIDARHALARADSVVAGIKRDGGDQIRVFDPARDAEPARDGTRPVLRPRDSAPGTDTGPA